MLEVGFRDPDQAFESFRTAFRGNLLDLEYRCLSEGFRSRNDNLSQFGYRLFRDELLARIPLLRYALHKAEVLSSERLSERRARITARAAGRTLVVDLVREDFWEIWAGSDRGEGDEDYVADLFEGRYLTVRAEDDPPRVIGQAPLRDPTLAERITELRLGQEWKIDDFHIVEAP